MSAECLTIIGTGIALAALIFTMLRALLMPPRSHRRLASGRGAGVTGQGARRGAPESPFGKVGL